MMYLLASVLALSCLLTSSVRRYAVSREIFDIPNHRSSHTVPTPRGGGLGFVVSFLCSIPFLYQFGFVALSTAVALIGSGVGIAILGFLDDHGHVSAFWRFLGHLTMSAFALYWLGGMPSLSFFSWTLHEGILASILGLFYLVWFLNLYNFMDGLDGLAASETLFVCLAGAFLYGLHGNYELVSLPLALATAVAGFLYWNLPPARIFMGDVGSGFLGLILGLFSIQAASVASNFFWSWLILSGVFVVDATITLFTRTYMGERIFEAHRTHAYQHEALRNGHKIVVLAVGWINVFWLLPMASLVAMGFVRGFFGLLIAYTPLFVLAFMLRAGRRSIDT